MTDHIAYYKDVIFYNGHFYTNNIKAVNLHNRIHEPYQPQDIGKLTSINNIEEYPNGIILLRGFHNNKGHLLWDCMYPSYYGLLFYKEEEYNINFQWMTLHNKYDAFGNGWDHNIIETFSGNKVTTATILKEKYKNPIRIPWLICGCKDIGIGAVNKNFLIGREFRNHSMDPVETFVNRMYMRYNIVRNLQCTVPYNVIYIHNKRPYRNIDKLLNDINIKYENKCNFRIIDWSKYNFKEQLEILNSTSIIICGVGTARGNTPFLPNGSIEIQTNEHSLTLPDNINYFDCHYGTISKNIKVINIPDYTVEESRGKLYSRYLPEYIDNAINMLPNNIPVDLESNIPIFVRNCIPLITDNEYIKWRKSGSNTFEDIFKTIK